MAKGRKKLLRRVDQSTSRMPDSVVYEKIVPVLLIGLGVLTAVLILAAIGIAFGLIPY